MSEALAGRVVVVTRPARQAAPFLRLLEAGGARALAFPTIAVEPVPVAAEIRALLESAGWDWVIYTSANAVEHSPAWPAAGTRIAAIGRATARALETRGLRVDALPVSGSDTEGLLALPAFGELAGRRVAIVKGVGGRDALRIGLAARGADVTTVEVYRRTPVDATAESVETLRRACADGHVVVAATSVEVLESLLRQAPESRVPGLLDAALVVPGERVAAAARGLGWRGPLAVARSAEDAAMLEAVASSGGGSGPSDPA